MLTWRPLLAQWPLVNADADPSRPAPDQSVRRHRGFTFPCDLLWFGGTAMTVMNDERAEERRTGAPYTPGVALADQVRDGVLADPPSTTVFRIAYEGAFLRLRHYEPEAPRRGPPVLLVYSFFKRPYVLDLLPDRSVVQSFLRQGLSVYLTDWLPPSNRDTLRGLHDYVERELANAVECIRHRERVRRVGLVGCCLGGFVATVYAALLSRAAHANLWPHVAKWLGADMDAVVRAYGDGAPDAVVGRTVG